MTDTTKTITFDDIVNIGKKRVDDTKIVEVPALGGSVKLRQISGSEHDAAIALGSVGDSFDQHAVARAQIIASLVEPELPADEAESIIDNLPVMAFGQLHQLVIAHSGLGVRGVEELVKMFRDAANAANPIEDGSASDHGSAGNLTDRVGAVDADADNGA